MSESSDHPLYKLRKKQIVFVIPQTQQQDSFQKRGQKVS